MGFVLFYFKSVKKVYQKQLQLEKARLEHQQELLRSAIQVEEKERRRFSRDLHDEAGALLAGVKLKVNLMQQEAGDPERVRQLSLEARELLGNTIQSIRNISHNLLPPSLETFGLFRCLEGFFQALQASVETDFHYKADLERLPSEVELSMYRVIAELCNNTLKHANASKISMYLEVNENVLSAVYRDNGRGMVQAAAQSSNGPLKGANAGQGADAEHGAGAAPGHGMWPGLKQAPGGAKPGPGPGLGLKNLESRISMLNGSITFESAPGQGMEARIEIPLSK